MTADVDKAAPRFGLRLTGLVTIFWVLSANGQNETESTHSGDRLHAVAVEGRELVLLAPYEPAPDGMRGMQSPVEELSVRSFSTASQQTIVVSIEGETLRAALPVQGPRRWLAFDPARRAFAELSASLRIELEEGVDLDVVADAVGATGVSVFESLGFAIIALPEDLHPAEAVSLVRNLPGRPDAAVRLRAPRIQWR